MLQPSGLGIYLVTETRVSKLGELHGSIPPIWKRMADQNGKVNSNYGYQWNTL